MMVDNVLSGRIAEYGRLSRVEQSRDVTRAFTHAMVWRRSYTPSECVNLEIK